MFGKQPSPAPLDPTFAELLEQSTPSTYPTVSPPSYASLAPDQSSDVIPNKIMSNPPNNANAHDSQGPQNPQLTERFYHYLRQVTGRFEEFTGDTLRFDPEITSYDRLRNIVEDRVRRGAPVGQLAARFGIPEAPMPPPPAQNMPNEMNPVRELKRELPTDSGSGDPDSSCSPAKQVKKN